MTARGWSSADSESEGPRLVIVPRPVFSGVSELRRYEEAVRLNPRKPGEGAMTYIARVAEAVQANREPGADDA